MLHALHGPAGLAAAARRVVAAWYLYIKRPDLPGQIAERCRGLYKLLANKFYFDEIYQVVFAGGSRILGTALWRVGDVALIDGAHGQRLGACRRLDVGRCCAACSRAISITTRSR